MSDSYILFVGDDGWAAAAVHDGQARVDAVAVDGSASLEARAQAANRQLADAGCRNQPIMLALSSSWCLCAAISTDDLERGGRRRAMAFRLEEHLPVAAEQIVADFVPVSDSEAMGVCCELEKLAALLAALEAAGIRVRRICPTAFLAAAHVAGLHPQVAGVLLGGGEAFAAGYDFIELDKGKPTRWWWLADDAEAVGERLTAWAASSQAPAQLALVGCDESLVKEFTSGRRIEHVEMVAVSRPQAAAVHAAAILDNTAAPWVDLRTEGLAARDPQEAYRKPLGTLVAAVAALLVCVSGVTQWRGRQYGAMAATCLQQQAEAFRAAMPNQRVPGSIKGRLLSERRRLAGLGGQGGEDANAGGLKTTSALVHLREVLTRLPADARFRIQELSIQQDQIRLDGLARTHAEAEGMAGALRQSGLYEVEPPKTQAMKDQGVSFVFSATPNAPPAAAKRGGQ